MKDKIYQGSSKSLYRSEDECALLMSFDDNLKVGDKSFEILGKGVINNSISSFIMQKLGMVGIDNHFVKKVNMRHQLVQYLDIIPIQLHICTVACDRFIKDFGIEEGVVFDNPIIDFRIKNKELNYPIINESQIINFGWLDAEDLKELKIQAIRVHDFIYGMFAGVGIRLVDCKLEFGRSIDFDESFFMLTDEISPDNCRLWDFDTNQKLSFEVVGEGVHKVTPSYQEIMKRLCINK